MIKTKAAFWNREWGSLLFHVYTVNKMTYKWDFSDSACSYWSRRKNLFETNQHLFDFLALTAAPSLSLSLSLSLVRGELTYWKASGQSFLGIHCHSICAGTGLPRAVHLRVGLLPYRYTSVFTATSFSMIWGGTVEEDIYSYQHSLLRASGSSRRDTEQRVRAIDNQLEGASLFLFGHLIGQDHSVIPGIHFCDSADDEIIFLPYSVDVFQW